MSSRAAICLILLLLLARVDAAGAESRSWLFVSLLEQRQIITFERDVASGELKRRGTTECPAEPAIMSVAPQGRTLFVSFRSTGQLASYRIDPTTGKLTSISVVDGGADPAYLLPDHRGRYLLSAYYVGNKVCVHAIGPDGALSAAPVQTVPTADKAHGIALDSTNRLAFVPHTGANRIYQFFFDPGEGRLTPAEPRFVATPAEDHPRHITLHPSDRWAYANNEAGDSLGVYEVDRRAATLRRVETVSTLPDGYGGERNATARCEMTRDGRFIYVANRGHDSIAAFAIDSTTGRIRRLGIFPTEKTPRSLTIDPQARFLYAAGQDSGKIACYRIADTGMLEPLAVYEAGPVAWCALAVDVPLRESGKAVNP